MKYMMKPQKKKNGHTLQLTSKSEIQVIRNISNEELKKELLDQDEIEVLIKEVKKKTQNVFLLNCTIQDMYLENMQSFQIDIEVNKETLILGTNENQQERLEELKEQRQVYVTLDENQKEKGKLVAKNIELMGC